MSEISKWDKISTKLKSIGVGGFLCKKIPNYLQQLETEKDLFVDISESGKLFFIIERLNVYIVLCLNECKNMYNEFSDEYGSLGDLIVDFIYDTMNFNFDIEEYCEEDDCLSMRYWKLINTNI